MSGAIANLIVGTGVNLSGLKSGLEGGKNELAKFKRDAQGKFDIDLGGKDPLSKAIANLYDPSQIDAKLKLPKEKIWHFANETVAAADEAFAKGDILGGITKSIAAEHSKLAAKFKDLGSQMGMQWTSAFQKTATVVAQQGGAIDIPGLRTQLYQTKSDKEFRSNLMALNKALPGDRNWNVSGEWSNSQKLHNKRGESGDQQERYRFLQRSYAGSRNSGWLPPSLLGWNTHQTGMSFEDPAKLQQLQQLGAGLRTGLGYVANAAAGVGAAFAGMAIKGVTAFMSLQTQMRSSRVVFGEASSAITAEVNKLAESGKSRSSSYEAAAGIGGMLRGAGIGQGQAAGITKEFLDVSASFARLRGMDFGEVTGAVQSGLLGMMRPLHRFGVSITDNQVELQAWKMGLRTSGEELSEQAKVMARSVLITEALAKQTAGAQPNRDTLADRMKEGLGSVENLFADIGESLEPAVAPLFDFLVETVKGIKGVFEENKAVIADWGGGFVAVVQFLGGAVVPVLSGIGATAKFLTGVFHQLQRFILESGAALAKFFGDSALADEFQAKADDAQKAFEKLDAPQKQVASEAKNAAGADRNGQGRNERGRGDRHEDDEGRRQDR